MTLLTVTCPEVTDPEATLTMRELLVQADPETGTRGRVEEDRKHHIEAAIVRIMKARRVLDYNSIVTEVTRQLSGRFQPQPSDVKKRMECLIEREFIERDANDRKMYHYLA